MDRYYHVNPINTENKVNMGTEVNPGPVKCPGDVREAMIRYADAGLSVLPTTLGVLNKLPKKPALHSWDPLKVEGPLSVAEIGDLLAGKRIRGGMRVKDLEYEPRKYRNGVFTDIAGVAVITGKVSGGLELIDVDSDKDPDGTIWRELTAAIAYDDVLSGLFKEFYIERSPGGLHILYRYEIDGEDPEILPSKVRAGNKDLAMIEREIALIETRGEGGYCVTYPTPGYVVEQGDLTDLPTLTKAERDRLIEVCRSLCRVKPPGYQHEPEQGHAQQRPGSPASGLTPFQDYNRRATVDTVRELLEAHGWTALPRSGRGNVQLMLRPDNGSPSTAESSGSVRMIEGRDGSPALPLFSVWTPNGAPFDPYKADGSKRAYRPHEVYAELEHGGDYSQAMRTLYRQGYGERRSTSEQVPVNEITVYYVNPANKENTVICEPGGELNIADVKAAPGKEFTIEAPDDVSDLIPAILLIQAAASYAYVIVGDAPPVRDYKYLADRLLSPYQEQDLDDPGRDRLATEIVETACRLRASDRTAFRDYMLKGYGLEEAGITEQMLKAAEAERTEAIRREKESRGLREDMQKAAALMERGEAYKAAKLLQDRTRGMSEEALPVEDLLAPFTEADLAASLKELPNDVYSGYKFFNRDHKGVKLMLPAQALTIVAGRTAHRKTTMMMNMALNIAQDPDVTGGVYFFSFEEDRAPLVLKFLNIYLNADLSDGGLGRADDNNVTTLKAFYKDPTKATKGIRDTSAQRAAFFETLINPRRLHVIRPEWRNAGQLCRAIEFIKKEERPAAIFIDYIQQLRDPEFTAQGRQLELQEICGQLRMTAVNTGLPLIFGAQFNREVKQEGDIDSDKLRQAGDIEQEANLVIGLWDRKYTKEGKRKQKGKEQEEIIGGHIDRNGNNAKHEPGILYAEILKARDADTGTTGELVYSPSTQRITGDRRIGGKGTAAGRDMF
jgi:replicative DNA helicase